MIRNLLTTIIISSYVPAFSQNDFSNMLVQMLKMEFKEMKENPPQEKPDDLLQLVPAFIPPDGKFDGGIMLNKYMDSVKNNSEISTRSAFLIQTEKGELRIGYIGVKTSWGIIPFWGDMNISVQITSAITSKGKQVIMPQETYRKYMEEGYIGDEPSYGPSQGESEMKTYLNEDPQEEEYPIKLKGEMLVSFPAEYSSTTFTAGDTGKTMRLGKYQITFLSMNKNTVMYRVAGPRGFSDEYKKLCTNKSGQPFNGRNGSSIDYSLYMEAKKNNFELPDSRLNQLAEDVQKNGMTENTDMIYIEKVTGVFSKITFYKVQKDGEIKVPFESDAN